MSLGTKFSLFRNEFIAHFYRHQLNDGNAFLLNIIILIVNSDTAVERLLRVCMFNCLGWVTVEWPFRWGWHI